jgi:hypothetical protein
MLIKKGGEQVMPNHVKNVWKIKHIDPKNLDTVLNKIAVKHTIPYSGKDEYIMDFDLIIPEPRIIQDCPKRFRMNKSSHAEKLPGREWFNWYDWHIDNWGTKWNAYDGYTIVGKSCITLVFNTAWSFPEPIARQVAEILKDYDIEIKYADEDWGFNCGRMRYSATSYHWEVDETEHDIDNPDRFARNLWNRY